MSPMLTGCRLCCGACSLSLLLKPAPGHPCISGKSKENKKFPFMQAARLGARLGARPGAWSVLPPAEERSLRCALLLSSLACFLLASR